MRAATMIWTLGATAQPSAPTRNSPAHTSRVRLRPIRSATRPPNSAPNAAPGNSRQLTTVASPNALSPRSSFMYSRAPEMTPVSYPNNSPPRVAITVSWVRNLPFERASPGVRDMCDLVSSLELTRVSNAREVYYGPVVQMCQPSLPGRAP